MLPPYQHFKNLISSWKIDGRSKNGSRLKIFWNEMEELNDYSSPNSLQIKYFIKRKIFYISMSSTNTNVPE